VNPWPLLPVGVFVGWRLAENALHRRRLGRIPLRVHVNGTRGKSQTVELIARGLNASGRRAAAKITGVTPTFILPDGRRQVISRLGAASIAEQVDVIRRAVRLDVDALVIECNAIDPGMQRASQDLIVQAQLGAITNVRADHTDALGRSEEDIAGAMAETIPIGGTVLTSEVKYLRVFQQMAVAKKAQCVQAPTCTVRELTAPTPLPRWVRRENLELALSVCEAAGADLSTALAGMLRADPPPDAWTLRKIHHRGGVLYVLNAFSANDPQSTRQLIDETLYWLGEERPLLGVFNHRRDRAFRVETFAPLLEDRKMERLFLIGDRVPRWRRRFPQAEYLVGKCHSQQMYDRILSAAPPGALIVGMGNIGGAGLQLSRLLGGTGEAL